MPKSKSAYSVSTKKEKSDTHIFVLWVANEAGVLARVVGLFSGNFFILTFPTGLVLLLNVEFITNQPH